MGDGEKDDKGDGNGEDKEFRVMLDGEKMLSADGWCVGEARGEGRRGTASVFPSEKRRGNAGLM